MPQWPRADMLMLAPLISRYTESNRHGGLSDQIVLVLTNFHSVLLLLLLLLNFSSMSGRTESLLCGPPHLDQITHQN